MEVEACRPDERAYGFPFQLLEPGASFCDRRAGDRCQCLVVDSDIVLVGIRQNSQSKQSLVGSFVDGGEPVLGNLVMRISHARSVASRLCNSRAAPIAAIPLASWGFSGGFPKDVAALCLVDHRSDAEKPLLELGDPVRAINEGW